MEMIKVSANSRTAAVAGAIAGVSRDHKHAEVQAIGDWNTAFVIVASIEYYL